jgi:uncharacterized protein YndB with AHSA1/START domain
MAARSDETERDFVLSRVFAAPRALVWKAWTEAEHLAAWWGPKDFTARAELDLRVGGAYRLVMVAPDGTEYPMFGRFLEIVAPERLVYTADLSEHDAAWHDLVDPERDKSKPHPAYLNETTVTLEALDAKTTRLTVRTRFESVDVRERFMRIGMNGGWSQSLDKMAAQLARASA